MSRGLAGVSFGHFLIKQVVEDLKREIPSLKTFVTLSPVPGFASWLRRERTAVDASLFDAEQRKTLDLLDTPRWFDDAAVCAEIDVYD